MNMRASKVGLLGYLQTSARPHLPSGECSQHPDDHMRRRSANHAATSRQENAAIRAWARSAGLPVSERGRISADVIRQYEVAH